MLVNNGFFLFLIQVDIVLLCKFFVSQIQPPSFSLVS